MTSTYTHVFHGFSWQDIL